MKEKSFIEMEAARRGIGLKPTKKKNVLKSFSKQFKPFKKSGTSKRRVKSYDKFDDTNYSNRELDIF